MRNIRLLSQAAICICVFAGLTGCATLLSGSSQTVSINSMPGGATVEIKTLVGNVIQSGMTPFSASLPKGKDYQVFVSLDGYQTAQLGFQKGGIETVAFCNTTSIPFWVIDHLTGSMYKIEPGALNVSLKKVTAQDGSNSVYAVITTVDEDGVPVHNMVEILPEIEM